MPIVKLGNSLLRSAVSLPALTQDAADAARWRFVRSAFELVQDLRRGKHYVICGSQWLVGEVHQTVDEAVDGLIAAGNPDAPPAPCTCGWCGGPDTAEG